MSYVGIDVSKDWLDVHVAPAGEDWRVSRDAKRLDELVTRLGNLTPQCIGVEATGRASSGASRWLPRLSPS